MELAWGCKPHSGWAIAVLVGGTAVTPVVLDRRRVQLCPDDLPRQVYHAAEAMGLPVIPAPPKRTLDEAAVVLAISRDTLAAHLTGLRAELGAPWQVDHKDATAAALMALELRR